MLSTSLFAFTVSDTTKTDTTLAYPFSGIESGGLYMNNPSIFSTFVEYDPITNQYYEWQRIGGRNVGFPRVMSFQEYQEYQLEKSTRTYWDLRTGERKVRQTSAFGLPKLYIGGLHEGFS